MYTIEENNIIAEIALHLDVGYTGPNKLGDMQRDLKRLLDIVRVDRRALLAQDTAATWERFATILGISIRSIQELNPKLPDYVTATLGVCAASATSIAEELRAKKQSG